MIGVKHARIYARCACVRLHGPDIGVRAVPGVGPDPERPPMIVGTCHCGSVRWTFDGMPESVTACNCTLCRRYGTLWIYDYEGERISVTGPTQAYTRSDAANPALEIHFCAICACVISWRGRRTDDHGRRRVAVNLRLTEPGPVAHLPIDHFDGLETFDDLPRDDRCVADMWF